MIKLKRKRPKLPISKGRKGSNPKTMLPKMKVEETRDAICVLVGIDRLKEDTGKPLRRWELAKLHSFILLVKDIASEQTIDPLNSL